MTLRQDATFTTDMGVINMTPHPIVFRDADGTPIGEPLPPSGRIARVTETEVDNFRIWISDEEVRVRGKVYEEVEGLPATPLTGTYFVVSLVTALAAQAAGRDVSDLYVPGEQTRKEDGSVNGCRDLAQLGQRGEGTYVQAAVNGNTESRLIDIGPLLAHVRAFAKKYNMTDGGIQRAIVGAMMKPSDWQ